MLNRFKFQYGHLQNNDHHIRRAFQAYHRIVQIHQMLRVPQKMICRTFSCRPTAANILATCTKYYAYQVDEKVAEVLHLSHKAKCWPSKNISKVRSSRACPTKGTPTAIRIQNWISCLENLSNVRHCTRLSKISKWIQTFQILTTIRPQGDAEIPARNTAKNAEMRKMESSVVLGLRCFNLLALPWCIHTSVVHPSRLSRSSVV